MFVNVNGYNSKYSGLYTMVLGKDRNVFEEMVSKGWSDVLDAFLREVDLRDVLCGDKGFDMFCKYYNVIEESLSHNINTYKCKKENISNLNNFNIHCNNSNIDDNDHINDYSHINSNNTKNINVININQDINKNTNNINIINNTNNIRINNNVGIFVSYSLYMIISNINTEKAIKTLLNKKEYFIELFKNLKDKKIKEITKAIIIEGINKNKESLKEIKEIILVDLKDLCGMF